MFRSGFVAVVGKPNVGKSTLINALVGKKVSIVSPKAQTTRNKILGIMNREDYQVVFIDTPGIHKAKNNLDKIMQKNISSATEDVDLLLFVLDGSKDFSNDDLNTLKSYLGKGYPVFAVVNKSDLGSFASIYPRLAKLNEINGLDDIFTVSAYKKTELEPLRAAIISKMTDDVKYYSQDVSLDQTEQFTLSELIREKILYKLNDEVPHGIGIVVESIEKTDKLISVYATVYCERESHKKIIIGNKGSTLKDIGTDSRLAMEKLLGKSVFLKLFVKVKENWRNKLNLNDSGIFD